MSRHSTNEYRNNRLQNGFDYERQAWAVDGLYINCWHPESMKCTCYGREHQGEETPIVSEKIIKLST